MEYFTVISKGENLERAKIPRARHAVKKVDLVCNFQGSRIDDDGFCLYDLDRMKIECQFLIWVLEFV